jgi:predicted phage terminase large subunit-like protein
VHGYQLGIGVDLAYSSRTSSDYSVAVCVAIERGKAHVIDVLRRQCSAPEFGSYLAAWRAKYPGARLRAYAHGTELGAIDYFKRSAGVNVEAMQCTGDKFVRAQPVSAAWNRGEVLVPRSAPWLGDFVSEVTEFTGVNDPHDDCVDALAAAYDEARAAVAASTSTPVSVMKPRQTAGLRKAF